MYSDSNVLALVLFLALILGIYHMTNQRLVTTYQCPGAVICKAHTLNKLRELGHLDIDITRCEVKTMPNGDFYTIQKLQKEIYSR